MGSNLTPSSDDLNAVNDNHQAPILMSIRESARLIGISYASIYNLVAAGKLTIFKIGRRSFIQTADLRAFVASLPATKRNGGIR